MPQGLKVTTVTGTAGNAAVNTGYDFQIASPGVASSEWEGAANSSPNAPPATPPAVTIPSGAGFTGLGPIELNGTFDRLAIRAAIGTSTLPAGGLQFQILVKETVNSPWTVAYTWAFLSALTPGIPSSVPLLYAYTDQATMVFPQNSNVTFNFDCRGLHAVELQCSTTAGAYGASVTQYANGTRN